MNFEWSCTSSSLRSEFESMSERPQTDLCQHLAWYLANLIGRALKQFNGNPKNSKMGYLSVKGNEGKDCIIRRYLSCRILILLVNQGSGFLS